MSWLRTLWDDDVCSAIMEKQDCGLFLPLEGISLGFADSSGGADYIKKLTFSVQHKTDTGRRQKLLLLSVTVLEPTWMFHS